MHRAADVDRGTIEERQALLAALVGPKLEGGLIHEPADRVMSAGDRVPGGVRVAVGRAGHLCRPPMTIHIQRGTDSGERVDQRGDGDAQRDRCRHHPRVDCLRREGERIHCG